MDVMASARRAWIPWAFRLAHLTNARMRPRLEATAGAFGQKWAKAPSGGRLRCSLHELSEHLCGHDGGGLGQKQSGNVRVKRVVCAQDAGEMINPEGVRLQIEGA